MSRPPVWAKKKKKAGGVGFQGPSWAGKLDGCCHDTEGCARRVAQRERERVEDMELGVAEQDVMEHDASNTRKPSPGTARFTAINASGRRIKKNSIG